MAKTNRTKTNKYPNGYAPKIQYWAEQLSEARNLEEKDYILDKIFYFTAKESARVDRLLMMERRDGEEILRYCGG